MEGIEKGVSGERRSPEQKNRVIYTRMCDASVGVAQNRGTRPTHGNVWLVFAGGNGVIALQSRCIQDIVAMMVLLFVPSHMFYNESHTLKCVAS